jgi:acetate kinase
MCDGLAFLGIQLDPARNEAHDAVISGPGSRVTVRVIHTDEERHIAQSVCRLLSVAGNRGTK